MSNYELINKDLIQFSKSERDKINKMFEDELRNECYQFMDPYSADEYTEITLDEMYRSAIEVHETPKGEIEEEFEWYEDEDGDLWCHEIPSSMTPGSIPILINTRPDDKTLLELFLGEDNYKRYQEQTQ